jgi:putative transcriptional regulator
MADGIAPGLLVAVPQMEDPSFARSVVLMIQHDQRGSLGLVVNRPTDLSMAEVMRDAAILWPARETQVVWHGGPVEAGPGSPQGLILHHPGRLTQGVARDDARSAGVAGAAGRTVPDFCLYPFPPPPEAAALLASEPAEHVRLYIGHAGWAPGQLELELLQDAWLLAPADPVLVFETPAQRMWDTAIRSLGVDPAVIVRGGGLH